MKTVYSIAAALLMLISAPMVNAESNTTDTYTEVRIFGSAALSRPLHEIGYIFEKEHPGVQLDYELSASGMMVNGILQGVPPDLFISAADKYQEAIIAAGKANFYEPIARDRLAVATQCLTPVYGLKVATFPQVITEKNLISKLMDPSTKLTIASPTLSSAGQHAVKMFEAVDKKIPGALQNIMRHANVVLDTDWVARAVENHETNIGILYASQIEGLRREGKCVNEVQIPKEYDAPQMSFTVSEVLKGTGHALSPDGEKLNDELQALYLSKRGQDIFAKWGLMPTK